jgi:hypothetical protein
MNRTSKLCFILLLITIPKLSFSQSEDKLGSWYIYNGFFKFNPKYELFFDAQLRTYEVLSNPETFFVRPYFSYNLNENIQPSLGLEYHKAWTYDDVPENKTYVEEFRVSLQMMIFQTVGRINFQHRYRYEFRDISGDKKQRMRYRIQATVPLNSKTIEKGTYLLNFFNEILVDTKPTFEFSQNWVYAAAGYQFNRNLNLQVGYLAIFRTGTLENRLQFFLTQKFWFYKE